MKKKPLGIILAIIIAISFLAGCGEHTEENGAKEIYESEAEISQTDRQTEVPTEVEEAPQTANSNETEEIAGSMGNEPDEENGEESVAPFIDEDLYLYIKGVYDEIDWDIQFLPGDESKYDLYREQFIKLLKEEIPVVDDKGYEKTLSHWGEIEMDINDSDYDPNHYNYYFFDVDGDGTPELGLTNNQRFVYIFKYEEEADRIVLWDEYIGGMNLMGTGKFYWSGPNGDWGMMGLAQDEDYTFLARFKVTGNPDYYNDENDVWVFFVALPDYVAIEEWMLKQATYLDSAYPYYFFRLTEEQYDELEERFLEASHKSHKEKEEVTYTYEELLNLKSDGKRKDSVVFVRG